MTAHECTRNNLCIDCDDTHCVFAGSEVADCPRYPTCDLLRYHEMDCYKCGWNKRYIEKMRGIYDSMDISR